MSGINNYINNFQKTICIDPCYENVIKCIQLYEEMNIRGLDTENFKEEHCYHYNVNLDCICRRIYRCMTGQQINIKESKTNDN